MAAPRRHRSAFFTEGCRRCELRGLREIPVTTKPHVAEAERIQREIIRKMTPAQKFAIARELYDTAWEIKT
jgi:hypothetical protein